MALTSLILNIPPLEPASMMAAAGLLRIFATTGCELTLIEVAPNLYSGSCLIHPNPNPIVVTGSSRADCLTKLLALLTPEATAPLPPVPEPPAPAPELPGEPPPEEPEP